eukprot:m.260171 g.260171  ORF g.260171 m.260171 type:complete len:57 (+) comp19211_c1_seq1:145-315(+)
MEETLCAEAHPARQTQHCVAHHHCWGSSVGAVGAVNTSCPAAGVQGHGLVFDALNQ